MPATPEPAQPPVLAVEDLSVSFDSEAGALTVVSEVGLRIERGATLALVGESGCGKSVTALAIMGLIQPPGRITGGSIRFDGNELVGLPQQAYRELRGNRIGMIFQEPMTSLNPVFTVGDQIAEVLTRHRDLDPREAREEAVALLDRVHIPSPQRRIDQYPHEMSGGMKQRVMIAIALACRPALLIADEPTTALDVTVQAQIMRLLGELQQEMGMAILLISHNLGLVAQYARDVAVMYAGRMAEQAAVRTLFRKPLHPYTRALLASLPRPGQHGRPLAAIAGSVPAPTDFPSGCRFSARCADALPRCATDPPPLVRPEPGHQVTCWLHAPDNGRG